MLFNSYLLFLIFFIIIGFYCYLRYHYDFWRRHGVAQIAPNYLFGNLGELLRMRNSPAEFIKELYNCPEAKNQPFMGIHIFYKPAIFLKDPELIKRILIKDFPKFSNRYSNSDAKKDPIGSLNVFFLKNPVWKEIRLKLTPFFTSGKIKQMFYLIEEVGRNLDAFLLSQPKSNDANDATSKSFVLELKEICALYTTDVIATVAYGVEANTLKNPNGEFRRNGREVFRFDLKRAFEFLFIFFLPEWVPFFSLKVVPNEQTQFLRKTIHYVIEEREKSKKQRHDLIDILIEFKNSTKLQQQQQQKLNNKNISKRLNLVFEGDILVAQAAIFFTAGFESSSATMSFALYELAKRPDYQQKLRAEIKKTLEKSKNATDDDEGIDEQRECHLTLQLIDSLEYMEMIIYETLRLYPPLPFLDRECTLTSEQQSYALEPFHKFAIPNGMPVYIPVYGLHMDPKYYANPEVFDPERFSTANKKLLTPYTYMPFGLGPHACIGERFGVLQTKIGLLNFLKNHYVTSCEKTRLEMKLDPKALILQAEGGIYLKVVHDPLIH